jgi:hypothetical protein
MREARRIESGEKQKNKVTNRSGKIVSSCHILWCPKGKCGAQLWGMKFHRTQLKFKTPTMYLQGKKIEHIFLFGRSVGKCSFAGFLLFLSLRKLSLQNGVL